MIAYLLRSAKHMLKQPESVNDPITYLELVGVDHFDVIDPHSDAWAITISELQKLIN